MKTFNHLTGESVEHVASVLEKSGPAARPVAGGTDLLGGLKDEIHSQAPETLIDLKRIKGLDGIQAVGRELEIGALVKVRTLEKDERIKADYPLLATAAHSVASPQLRNMGTLGGNLCQEPRCWYYRYPDNFFHCLRKGGDSCPAFIGENRFHSIYGAARVGERPCTGHCPASVAIPEYMDRLRAGDWDGAAEILLTSNPIPAVTGRVCPHFCQDGCNRQDLDEPVSIRNVERRLGDYILANASRFHVAPEAESGRSAAVIGSGPAGLAAAHYLRRAGHKVTVFDRLERAGGMLSHAIPAYRLPPKVVDGIIDAWRAMGIDFRLGGEIDAAALAGLQEHHDAVFAGPGAWAAPKLGIPGKELSESGLEMLTRAANGQVSRSQSRVVVIGGGNVAVDVGLTAKRLGADRVTLVCLEARDQMPASDWEIAQAEEEGIEVLPGWGPNAIHRGEAELTIDLVRCTSVFDDQGTFCPAYDPERMENITADAVYLAVGQRADSAFMGVERLDQRGLIKINDGHRTVTDNLLAGGDAVTGPASVVEALAAGAGAAAELNARWGVASTPCPDRGDHLAFSPGVTGESRPVAEEMLPRNQRTLDSEDAATISSGAALAEAGRCFNCGCVAVSPTDIAPALIALEATILTSTREIPAEEFFSPAVQGSTVLGRGELVTGVRLPEADRNLKWGFEKYRIRKAIDFPIASVAVSLAMDGEIVSRARIALGAVSPVPLRVRMAEELLEGRKVDPQAAAEAAAAAVRHTLPLSENEYKITIIVALIQRTILAAS